MGVDGTGPLPGTTRSMRSSTLNVSPGRGFPVTASRRPWKRTVAANG